MATNTYEEMKTNLEKALILNRKMQAELLIVRGNLENLLSNVKDAYKSNDLSLKEGGVKRKKGVGIKGAYLKGGTFYLKGNMFFKDINCRNCPNNQDYEKRKRENEMFPMDLNLKSRHVWSTPDKQGVIMGIKEQIIDYLKKPSLRRGKTHNELDSEKLAKLLSLVPKDFSIDWDHLSSYNVQHRHSPKTCEAIWNLFLHPSLKRTAWTVKENHKLLEAGKQYSFQDWQAIANVVGQRSDFQCFVQYKNYACHMLPESFTKWSKDDDKRLLEVIAKNNVNGIINWSNVNSYFPHKAKNTLHSRYNHTLNPDIHIGVPFTAEEDLLLIAAVKEYGHKFNCIPRTLFPNRSLIQLRTHYNNVLAKRHHRLPWSLEDDIKLMESVTIHGTKSWTVFEKSFDGKHTRISCRTRFLTIKNYLEKNPDASIEDIPRKQYAPRSTVNIENWKEKVEELSSKPDDEKLKNEELQKQKHEKLKNRKSEKVKKPKQNKKLKIAVEEKTVPIEETLPNVEQIQPVDEKTQQISENLQQSMAENIQLLKNISERRLSDKPYVSRLRKNGKKNYNFFKYAYNFNMKQHPCDSVQINKKDFAIAMSALNPQIPISIENCKYDSSIPDHIKRNIKNNSPQLSIYQKLQRLPPNWSTAMGFRALCIHTASISTNESSEHLVDNPNDVTRTFRERLRSVFYSTALLSRLNPGMVGIEMPKTQPKAVKRKYIRKNTNNKKKCTETIENIKTEFET